MIPIIQGPGDVLAEYFEAEGVLYDSWGLPFGRVIPDINPFSSIFNPNSMVQAENNASEPFGRGIQGDK